MIDQPGDRSALQCASVDDTLGPAAVAAQHDRLATLHALHALEYALAAPAPRRQRTWVHRVAAAVDVLIEALDRESSNLEGSRLLATLQERHPVRAQAIGELSQEGKDVRIAATALREQLDCGPAALVDAQSIRDRLAILTRRYREHSAQEADLVYDLANLDLTRVAGRARYPTQPSGSTDGHALDHSVR